MSFRCYSQRLLNPFRGIVCYVSYESTDAVTADGSAWDIYVSNAALLEGLEPGRRMQISDIRYGSWSAQAGLKRGPILPSDDFMLMEAMGTQVYEHLLEVSDQAPFPFADHYELWLLDREARPLALIDSAPDLDSIDLKQAPVWRPGLDCQRTFTSAVAGELTGREERTGAVAEYLATYINGLTDTTAAAQVFHRADDGSGQGLGGIRLADSLARRTLPRDAFPEQLLDTRHHDTAHTQLVEDFIRWQAPWQLLLPGLDTETRRAFEQHARVQPLKVAAQYRLYPEIVDRAVIDAARVEARLRATHPSRQPAEKVMSTFYIELSPEVVN